jgi:hypothetical protein
MPVDEVRDRLGDAARSSDGRSSLPGYLAIATVEHLHIIDRPVWAFIERGDCGRVGYPRLGPPSETPDTMNPGARCELVKVADAATGEFLYGYSGPEDMDALAPKDFVPGYVAPDKLLQGRP